MISAVPGKPGFPCLGAHGINVTIVIDIKATAAVIEAEIRPVTRLMASGEPASIDREWFCKV